MNAPASDDSFNARVLLLAPTSRDATVTMDLLHRGGIACHICATPHDLSRELQLGAGALLFTEESLEREGGEELLRRLQSQPSWSELPIIVLLQAGGVQSTVAAEVLEALGNVTLLERPAPIRSVISAVKAALRARRRQYQIRDQITAIRSGEEAVRQSREQYRLLVELSPDAVFVNAGGVIAFVNPSMVRLMGAASESELLGRVPTDFIPSHSASDAPWATLSVAASVVAHDQKLLRFDGSTIEVEAIAVTIPWTNGHAVQVIMRDITERQRNARERESLLASERGARSEAERANRMKDEFLATVSHELRTPLNAILGWAQILRRGKSVDAIPTGLEVIERNARLQTQLIEDLLDMSRIISGKLRLEMRPISIDSVVASAVESIKPSADDKGVAIEMVVEQPCQVDGDAGRLQQIFWNLFSNSVKFTPIGGRISAVIRQVAGLVEVRVSDTGQGMPQEFLPHLFERFRQGDSSSTRLHGGLGLGLAIVKQLVELHGGTISAESGGTGSGSTFTVRLPAALKNSTLLSPRNAFSCGLPAMLVDDPMPDLSGIVVLVVDDDDDARSLVERLLIDCHATVYTASSGALALESLARFQPNVLLSDISMPEMDGYQFIQKVRSMSPALRDLPAAAITAFARAQDRRRALAAGYQSHITKPIEPSMLIAVVASLASREALKPIS